MRWPVVAVTVAVACVGARAASADEAPRDAIERARELEARLAYDEALPIIEAAIAGGQSDRARLVELHLIAGRLNAGLDRAKPAEDHFAIVLALAPSTTLADGTSPKIGVPFTIARAHSVPLAIELVVTKEAVAVEPTADPLKLVTGISIRFRKHDHDDALRARDSLRVPRDPEATLLEVSALDRHGNVLWVGVPPVENPSVVPPPPGDGPSLFGRWSTWAAVTGVALAAGGIAAWRFDVAQDEFDTKRDAGLTDFTTLEAIKARGRRWGIAANVSFGVAAATGIVSVVLFARRSREPSVMVTATPASVGVAGRF